MHKFIFNAFVYRFIKELPGDTRTGYHNQDEASRKHSFSMYFTSSNTSWYMKIKIIAAQLSSPIQKTHF